LRPPRQAHCATLALPPSLKLRRTAVASAEAGRSSLRSVRLLRSRSRRRLSRRSLGVGGPLRSHHVLTATLERTCERLCLCAKRDEKPLTTTQTGTSRGQLLHPSTRGVSFAHRYEVLLYSSYLPARLPQSGSSQPPESPSQAEVRPARTGPTAPSSICSRRLRGSFSPRVGPESLIGRVAGRRTPFL
jgi:hypothetical protein